MFSRSAPFSRWFDNNNNNYSFGIDLRGSWVVDANKNNKINKNFKIYKITLKLSLLVLKLGFRLMLFFPIITWPWID
jgi:hypothetical protein